MKQRKQKSESWNPNLFLSSQFEIHREIFNLPVRDSYVELSSGVNHFPAPSIWKETISRELEEDFLYQQYTSLDGFQAVKYASILYERFLYSRGNVLLREDLDVCMTIGASQAADLALDYLHSIGKKKLLLVGMTYPLYDTLGKYYGFQIQESRSRLKDKDMPMVEELKQSIESFAPDVILFSYPCNPSGEKYTDKEMDQIMQFIKEKQTHCIFDCVCNMIISQNEVTIPEPFILKYRILNRSIIINSLSKTESVPGFRIGYIAGNHELIQFVRSKQIVLMNPPNVPAIAVWLTMLFRCLCLCEQYGKSETDKKKIVRCFRRVFSITTVLCSQKVRDYVNELIDVRLGEEYEKYKSGFIARERIFMANKAYLTERLSTFLYSSTQMDAGYNYLIKLEPCKNIGEQEFCKQVLHNTGIAIFTESGFALKKAKENDYWVRISLAMPENRFQMAIDRFYSFLVNAKNL